MAKTTKTNAKATKKVNAKKERKPLPELKGDTAEQMKSIQAHAAHLMAEVDKSSVPVVHLRRFFSDLGREFRARMTARAGDPIARKRARIALRLEKLRQELAELEEKDSSKKAKVA